MTDKSKPRRGLEIALLALSLLLAVGARKLFHGCPIKEDGTWMHCHQAEDMVFWLGLAMAALSAAHLALGAKLKLAADVLILVLAVLAVLAPGVIHPLCMMAGMRCQAVLKPAARVLGALIALAAAADGAVRLRQIH